MESVMKSNYVVRDEKARLFRSAWTWSGRHWTSDIGKAAEFSTKIEAEKLVKEWADHAGKKVPKFEVLPISSFYETRWFFEGGRFTKRERLRGTEESAWHGFKSKREAVKCSLEEDREDLRNELKTVAKLRRNIKAARKAIKRIA
jgi:hypothetical protein